MKLFALVLAALFAALSLVGCQSQVDEKNASSLPTENTLSVSEEASAPAQDAEPVSEVSMEEPAVRDIDFTVNYISDDIFSSDKNYPRVRWISDASELRENGKAYLQKSLASYDEAFFETHDLLAIFLEEPSGSITHQMKSVTVSISGLDRVKYFIKPTIERNVPVGLTWDMKYHTILIAVDKAYGHENCEIQTPEVISNLPLD